MADLILLTTPIGNKEDLSTHAKSILRDSLFFLAEDTRRLMNLLALLDISVAGKSIQSFYEHGKFKKEDAVKWILEKKRVVLVSDAGSPVISDPAFPLVEACHKNGIRVKSCPGASSIIVALEQSALPPVPFHFHGFFPRKTSACKLAIEKTLLQKGTHLFFESPKRIVKTLDTVFFYSSLDNIVLARELTKTYEEMIFITREYWSSLKNEINQKGEFVLLYYVKEIQKIKQTDLPLLADEYLKKPTRKKLSRILAKILKKDAKDIYDQLLY